MNWSIVKTIVLLFFSSCTAIKVPVLWDDNRSYDNFNSDSPNSDYKQAESVTDVESFIPQNVNFNSDSVQRPIPADYFKYTARKPQFAVDVAAFHGVPNPEQLYQAYPVKPHTGLRKPVFGKHYINEQDRLIFDQFQRFANNKANYQSQPVISNYEVFHPYKAEEPALKQIYKDPTLLKIRNDIHENKIRLQNYEKQAGEPNVSKEEYLQDPEEIDKDKFPIKNEPARYEIYKPQRKPIYYKRPQTFSRDRYLNRKFKHPLYQHYVKIRPSSYRPLKNNIHKLRQEQAQKYDDEHNEYPQIRPENIEEPTDGYDIYERGKQRYVQLRNNVDNEVNKASLQSRQPTYENLELQNNGNEAEQHASSDEEEEFVPIKNYAQVRRTETRKHLPREAALSEAATYEEIENAPRLREAVKSTKSQTVYTEEGYEDAAYDHAGEQKHASDHEGHGGHLKEHEKSKGKFKVPEVSGSYTDGHDSETGDEYVGGKKWENNEKDTQEQVDDEGSNQDDYDESIEADIYESVPVPGESRNHDVKILPNENTDNKNDIADHDVNKREANFKIPELNLNNTYLTELDILNIPKNKEPLEDEYIKIKYPYYQKLNEELSKHSPLRYAESLNRIPTKTKGGTEFYDSRSIFECPEVDEELDPVPENVKEAENNQNEDKSRKTRSTDVVKEKPRLKGLGDKIDCFKAKYFGKNPLDSPFFKEEIISNPEPIRIPNISTYKLKDSPEVTGQESQSNNVYSLAENLRQQNKKDIFDLIEKLRSNKFYFSKQPLVSLNRTYQNETGTDLLSMNKNKNQYDILSNIFENIENKSKTQNKTINIDKIIPNLLSQNKDELNATNITYNAFTKKEDVLKPTATSRRKRSSTFVYEPYKVIRDNNQSLESKKTTTLSNISPLIKQLQSSRVVEVLPNTDENKRKKEKQPVKRNIRNKQYKDIGRKDRNYNETKELYPSITDVNIDNRKVEPSYEITYSNHKNTYTPVENKKSLTTDDYIAMKQQDKNEKSDNRTNDTSIKQNISRRPVSRPFFDVSQYLPKAINFHTTVPPTSRAAPNRVHSTAIPPTKDSHKEDLITPVPSDDDSEEYYDDEDEEDEEEEEESTTIRSPLRIIKPEITTTTQKPEEEISTPQPKLKLVTRFRAPTKDDLESGEIIDQNKQTRNPNFSEKTKKSTKSTLVTDIKKYGDGEDDMRKDEIDAMIGIQQDMDEYMPQYEKHEKQKLHSKEQSNEDSSEEDEDDDEYDDEEDEEDEDDDSSSEEIIEDEDVQDEDEEPVTNKPEKKDDKEERSENKLQPIVLRKKIEIHKEIPVNKSLPYTSQYKEDIVEEETVKKLPKKNLEALELYKDDGLAKKVNKLADVEVFKADLSLKGSPKHGGNYRRHHEKETKSNNDDDEEVIIISDEKTDAETSPSKNAKLIQLDDHRHINTPTRIRITKPSTQVRGRKQDTVVSQPLTRKEPEKPIEIVNLRSNNNRLRGQRGKNTATEKLKDMQDSTTQFSVRRRRIQTQSSKPEIDESQPLVRAMHGGNLKALTEPKSGQIQAANVLNSFAQAVPVLTTTPAYILDPSKRMYFYVDA